MRALRAADFEHIQILQLILSKILPSSPGQLEAGTRLPLPSSLMMGTCLQTTDRHQSSCPLNMARAKFKEAEKVGDASILKMAKGLNSALEQLYGSCALNFLAILLPLPCK